MKVLIITYYWPPSGGAGVQRWVKFAKYLPEHGWEPVIITVDPAFAAYPVTDQTLFSEISDSTEVHKTKARNYFSFYKDRTKIPSAGFAINQDDSFKGKILRFIRGNFFIPDPRKGWNTYALRKAEELIKSLDIKVVITTSPPHSTQLIGLRLKKKHPGLRWIADLRDPWTDIYYYNEFYPTILSKSIDTAYERRVIKSADSIITVGNSLKKLYLDKYPEAAKKISVISNGYDPDDFCENADEPHKFIITYTGTLSDIYPAGGFLNALKKVKIDYSLRFVGSVSGKWSDYIRSEIPAGKTEFIPYVDHRRAVRYMRESSALLLIIPDHQSSRSILTGKIFEYLASGKPVICLGPTSGDASELLQETGNGKAFAYDDHDGITLYLEEISAGKLRQQTAPPEYSRPELTKKLASLLGSVR